MKAVKMGYMVWYLSILIYYEPVKLNIKTIEIMDKNSTIRDIKLSKDEELKYIKPLMYKLWEATRGTLKYFDNDDNDSPFYVTVGVLVNNLAYAKSVGEANDIVDCIESLCLHLGRDHHLTWSVYLTVKESVDLAVDEFDC